MTAKPDVDNVGAGRAAKGANPVFYSSRRFDCIHGSAVHKLMA